MASQPQLHLSRRERQVMDIVYLLKEATTNQVLQNMADPPSRNAVRTFLKILEDKGHLTHRKEGKEYVFKPIRARKRQGKSALRAVLDTFFDGSLEDAVAHHLSDRSTKLTDEELARLSKLINGARKKGS